MSKRRSIQVGVRLGKSFADLGFVPSADKCGQCGKRGRIVKREFTGEFWCAHCFWGALYDGTKQRDELSWFFGKDDAA